MSGCQTNLELLAAAVVPTPTAADSVLIPVKLKPPPSVVKILLDP